MMLLIIVKKNSPGPIVIGGPSVGISGREMLEYFDLEYAIRGDGEAVMPEFVKRIENHAAAGRIKRTDHSKRKDNYSG